MNLVHKDFGTLWIEKRKDDSIWFSAKDVCDALGYTNDSKAIKDHIPEKNKGVTIRDTPGGRQPIAVINEAGLYRLILRSRMPDAEKFTDWVTEDVLPSIRKTGRYEAKQQARIEAKDDLKATLALLAEMKVYLTGTDIRQVSQKLKINDINVNRVLNGQDQDPAILAELHARYLRNKPLHRLYYTREGVESIMKIMK